MCTQSKPRRSNLCGQVIALLRRELPGNMSQCQLAIEMYMYGIDVGKNTIQRIESGERLVSDIELKAFSEFFGVPVEKMLTPNMPQIYYFE